MIRYLSICDGIGAIHLASQPLGVVQPVGRSPRPEDKQGNPHPADVEFSDRNVVPKEKEVI